MFAFQNIPDKEEETSTMLLLLTKDRFYLKIILTLHSTTTVEENWKNSMMKLETWNNISHLRNYFLFQTT